MFIIFCVCQETQEYSPCPAAIGPLLALLVILPLTLNLPSLACDSLRASSIVKLSDKHEYGVESNNGWIDRRMMHDQAAPGHRSLVSAAWPLCV